MGKPIDVMDSDFEDTVLNSETPVLVDFWAEWCAPCKMIAPVLDELAEEFDGTVKFTKLDVDRSEEHTSELQSLVNLVCRLLLEKKNIK
mgnify:CR=1 FL=1